MNEDEKPTAVEETPADSSPAADPSESVTLDLSPDEYKEWLSKGTYPDRYNAEPKKGDAKDDSGQADDADSDKPAKGSPQKEETSETEAASETDKDKQATAKPQPKPKANAETRKEQLARQIREQLDQRKALQSEIAELESKRKALATEPPPAASKPAKETTTTPAETMPTKPAWADFEREGKTWDEYETAKDKYFADLLEHQRTELTKSQERLVKEAIAAERKERETLAEAERIKEENRKIAESWSKRESAALKRHGDDFKDAMAAVPKEFLTPTIDGYLVKQELGVEILYALGKDLLDGGDQLEQIAALDPYDQVEALADLKRQIAEELKPQEKKPVLPRATKPPTDLGGKNASPTDEIAAALERNDVSAYLQAMNKKEGINSISFRRR